MDKYTVDLDQVLNDFEYSELTDQHGFEQAKAAAKNPPGYVHNNFKNTNVKHSINNVFHSLNEYLNSDISPKCEVKPVVTEASYSGEAQVDNNPPEAPETADNSCNEETVTPPKEEDLICIDTEVVEIHEPEAESCDDSDDDKSPETESEHVALIETTEESIKQKTDSIEETPVENSVLEIVKTEEDVVKTEDDNSVIKIGFDDDLDLDESELNRYLDELEEEYKNEAPSEEVTEGCETQNVEDVVVEEKPIEEPKVEVEEDETISNPRPNNLALPSQEGDDSTKSVIDLVGEPGSTPYNNVYINKELPQEKQNSDTECSTSASPTFSDISTETNSSCTPSTDTVNDENQNEDGAGDSKNEDTVEAKEEAKSEENGETNEAGGNPVEAVNGGGESSEPPPPPPPPPEQSATTTNNSWLGKQAPLWIPDAEATSCLHCEQKFTVIKRRHHCRACGYVLCSKCCNLKYRLEYLEDVARVCNKCYDILAKEATSSSGSESNSPRMSQPNPNNPLEYCSTVPPHQQVSGTNQNPPAVMVPVGVLKRKGSNKARTNKSVMFCDGIRPGSDLTNLDNDFSYSGGSKREEGVKVSDRSFPVMDGDTKSFIPKGEDLPPTVTINKTDVSYLECSNGPNVVEMLKNEALIFALQPNLLVHVKVINMDCCINKIAWCFSTEGLINVGQDEIVILLELLDDEKTVPKDVFLHINNIYLEAVKGTSVKEMGLSLHNTTNFLGSKNHAGFVYIRPTFQCLQNVIKPQEPYLIGVLIHRWETPWAKLFPLRLVLRLGAEYRYYPSPIISNRYRDSVFVEIGHTIINLLADFRNFSYTLPQIRGLTIHMEDKNTTVTIPINRYDQVMKSMNNSSDHILAFAGNFSNLADSHLVCIQDTQSNENAYSTHAINIHNKPRKVTGASFIVFNGALKSSSGLTAKSSIVEDGLMIQIPPEHMTQIRDSLRNMKNHTIQCGCINAASDETVNVIWGEPDVNFNINVFSPIDNKPMEGIPSIRVHNGKDYVNGGRLIRWTEVFINEGEASRNQDPIDISKVSETIAKATCTALVKYLDLLVSNSFYKIGIRANLNAYFVAYSAGSNAMKLPPIYMESLDNELVPVLHRNATSDCDENTIILELIFRILNK
ncbi:zinc finger FYVE domain-containing protein 9 isoform X2 [Zophobas morio]|uniref:zinc finger FYVE domain-containing protein 9 isoform X2 n=1 Tax=Zophobas morio TaxID=2755281 RepID=UPI003082B01A